jgi:hypothetical protein
MWAASNQEDDAWTSAMRRGDFESAWAISDEGLQARLKAGAFRYDIPRHLQHIWRGEPLAGQRVLVRCYHGLGDTIQFVRFAPALKRIAREVIWWVQPSLIDVVRAAPDVDLILPLHDGVPEVEYDVDVESMEIPHALRASWQDISGPVPYLSARSSADLTSDDSAFSVGLVWRAGGWDERRSIAPELLRRLNVSGVRLCSLQIGDAARAAGSIGATDISTEDVVEAAARIRRLDLVITVDTMMAHLAGALGCRVWTLLHADCDWRWSKGAECVWYPTMKLFHQSQAGDWNSVIDEVSAALIAATKKKRKKKLTLAAM